MNKLHTSLVQVDGINCSGTWYYHPGILVHLGEECKVRISGLGEKATIYSMDGSRWNGEAIPMVTVNVPAINKTKRNKRGK